MDKKKLAREELIGLHVKIKECKDPSWIGKSGVILDETKNTFLLEIDDQKKTIPKNIASFELFSFDHQFLRGRYSLKLMIKRKQFQRISHHLNLNMKEKKSR